MKSDSTKHLLLSVLALFSIMTFSCADESDSSNPDAIEAPAVNEAEVGRAQALIQRNTTPSSCQKWSWAVIRYKVDLLKPIYRQDYYTLPYLVTAGHFDIINWYTWIWVQPVWENRTYKYPWLTLIGYEKSPVYGWANSGIEQVNINDPVQEWSKRDPDNPVLASCFNSGNKIKWYWGGCTTLVGVLEDGPVKEILLVDGYVDKEAYGTYDFLISPFGLDRVKRYADFISSLIGKGFKVKGLLLSHAHADHVGDVPFLMYHLKQMNPNMEKFPIITDYYTYKAANKPIINEDIINLFKPGFREEFRQFNELVTDLIIYNWKTTNTADTVRNRIARNEGKSEIESEYNPISSFTKGYSESYSVYNMASGNFSSSLISENHLQLGKFSISTRLFDHAYVPGVSEYMRVNSFQVWNSDYGNRGNVLIMDSTDNSSFIPSWVTINTDHLFLTWAPYTLNLVDESDTIIGMHGNRRETSTTVRTHVRFYTNTSDIHYIVPMHVDDIMAPTYDTGVVCNTSVITTLSGRIDVIGYTTPVVLPTYQLIGYFVPIHPYSMPYIMMSGNEYMRGPYLGTYSEILPLANHLIKTPHVDLLRWSGFREFYYYAPQITEKDAPKVAFALFGKRLGIDPIQYQ